ncbi:hypothetical protein CAOG_05924 [Capsaspora owczarzaki ATCC 30864]|uniref:Hexosyltransferase n=1 Tax=Capsaspora owczarzaki (strain ATCC 30864) TaxID=595528 RepID=A0A0D2WT13_CAPO3|nr:hypothetical protein CAOG_05924 [Capsaspora owczarzaki ATCC 30864]KJE95475.1 hypothetical protein CAOG_005924 [Capsaspora owczarzaki ATCC 30864]|eukprot:XP_004345514.1 hypothetical protein CAOG_05924 [Capsaspora owczarzaki ATCC 30864]
MAYFATLSDSADGPGAVSRWEPMQEHKPPPPLLHIDTNLVIQPGTSSSQTSLTHAAEEPGDPRSSSRRSSHLSTTNKRYPARSKTIIKAPAALESNEDRLDELARLMALAAPLEARLQQLEPWRAAATLVAKDAWHKTSGKQFQMLDATLQAASARRRRDLMSDWQFPANTTLARVEPARMPSTNARLPVPNPSKIAHSLFTVEHNLPASLALPAFVSGPARSAVSSARIALPKRFLLIGVLSANTYRRAAIRETWAADAFKHGVEVRFVLTETEGNGAAVRDEQARYGDLLLIKDKVNYHSLVRKTYGFLRWALQEREVRFIFKTDDDTFVNIPRLLRFLTTQAPIRQLIMGYPWVDKPIATAATAFSRNAEYANSTGLDRYPKYMSGAGIVLTPDVIRSLIVAQHYVPMHQWPREDATFSAWIWGLNLQRWPQIEFLPLSERAPNVDMCINMFLHHCDVLSTAVKAMQNCTPA